MALADLELLADGAHDLAAQLVLVGEVPVEGGRLDAELPGQAAEGEGRRALGVHERDRLLDDLFPGEPGAAPPGPATAPASTALDGARAVDDGH